MTRTRSNALTDSSDPRFRSPSEIALRSELYKPYEMADTLTSFLQRVYAKPNIMSGDASKGHESKTLKSGVKVLAPKGPSIADLVYSLYSSSGADGGGDYQVNKKVVADIWKVVSADPVLKKGRLQYTKVSLKSLVEATQTMQPAGKYFTDFIYFDIGGRPTTRVYLNAKIDCAAKVAKTVKDYISGNSEHGISAFKIVGPGAMAGRADTVVCYCKSKDKAQALGESLAKNKEFFNAEVPGMTSKIANGVALGAEPAPQATGFGNNPEGYPESAQSFGSIRSQLIAAAIENYNANKHIFGSSFQVFKQFVAVAFRCNGLDPEHPGD